MEFLVFILLDQEEIALCTSVNISWAVHLQVDFIQLNIRQARQSYQSARAIYLYLLQC